jgi:serine phosphatase RsbU (regulator of sigma subunit)
MGMADSALVHLKEAYAQCEKHIKPGNSIFVEYLTWIGNAYNMKRDFRKALESQLRAAKMARDQNNPWGENDCYRYAAYAYANLKMPDSTIYYLKKCEDYLLTTKAYERIYFVGTELIKQLSRNKRAGEAEKYMRILEDTTAFGSNWKKTENTRAWMDLAQLNYYKTKGHHEKALASLLDYQVIKDSLEKRRNRANVGEQDLKAEFQKQQEQEKLEQQKKDFEAQDKLKKQKIFNYAMLAVIAVVALLLFMAYKIIRDKKKAFIEISQQKEEVEKQKTIVETKNKEISDSINYAKRLQEAILPDNTYLKSHFNDSFVFYKPKDVVAGDFYFFEKTEDQIIVAACDCTGHGVPGALVSVVCSNALTRSIKEFGITEPGKLLDKTRELVIETFEKSHANVKDGMDISLISFKTTYSDTVEINWSGANNPLWYVQNNELKEIKPHKQSICKNDTYEKFPTHQVTLKKGDTLYLITDGFADQFGGPKGKKFKYKQLQELLQNSITSPLNDQLKTVDQTFSDWKGELEQVDDVTLIALRV